MLNFGKRTAIVTGGTKTIGLSIAKQFIEAGLNVAIVSSNVENIDNTLKELNFENVMGIVYDLKQISNIDSVLTKVNDRFGSIDIIVNNAGGSIKNGKFFILPPCWKK